MEQKAKKKNKQTRSLSGLELAVLVVCFSFPLSGETMGWLNLLHLLGQAARNVQALFRTVEENQPPANRKRLA